MQSMTTTPTADPTATTTAAPTAGPTAVATADPTAVPTAGTTSTDWQQLHTSMDVLNGFTEVMVVALCILCFFAVAQLIMSVRR